MSQPTVQQQEAINATGGVLLSAGAGTGKTATLIARCVRLVMEENVSVDELLVVAFTNAAADEMKQRLREALQAKLAGHPDDQRLQQQLLLLDGAHISTIHSFCFELIRAHFAELELDPGVTVLEESITRPLEKETARQVITNAIAREDVRRLASHYFGGSGERLVEQILKAHRFYVKQPHAADLLEKDLRRFDPDKPEDWKKERERIVKDWLLEWKEPVAWQIEQTLAALQNVKGYGGKIVTADGIRVIEDRLPQFLNRLTTFSAECAFKKAVALLDEVKEISQPDFWARGTGNKRGLLKDFFAEASELAAWLSSEGKDPLDDEWQLVRGPMQTLLALTQAFAKEFSVAKRALGGVDFSDLEQLALQLLQDESIAAPWRQRFKHVFVDECQDINAAQDALIQAMSRRDEHANLFMVGDVKQSIYRFRMAAPELFRGYACSWKDRAYHRVLALNENFRSRAAILEFANDLFDSLMGTGFGGVGYGANDRLRFGQPVNGERSPLSLQPPGNNRPQNHWSEADCCVELHLVNTKASQVDAAGGETDGSRHNDDWDDLLVIDQQARLVAGRLREMMDGKHQVWDKRENRFRDMKWSDVGLLMRAVSGRTGAFLREFRRRGISLVAEQGDFLATLEAQDLTALLRVLDNPCQDIPLFAVLRSPLVGLSLDELLAARVLGKGPDALRRLEQVKDNPVIRQFLGQLDRWRRLALISSLSCVLETALAETRYEAFLLTLEDGPERVANVRRFLDLARRYDPLQRQGLHRFLKFIADQQEAEEEIEPLPPRQPDAVQLMSIHKSKGLEFPIVVLTGIGSRFNQPELREGILFSRRLGVAPQVVDPDLQLRQDSLIRWQVRREEERESVAEELRLLYVAITRARDTLLLMGSFNPESETWKQRTEYPPRLGVGRVRSYCEWIGMWLAARADWATGQGEVKFPAGGQTARLRWQVHVGSGALPAEACGRQAEKPRVLTTEQLDSFSWKYGNIPATTAPAKTSASALRRFGEERDEEIADLPTVRARPGKTVGKLGSEMAAADVGTAHHKFLQHVDLAQVGSEAGLQAEVNRLRETGILTGDEAEAVDRSAVLKFWQSPFGMEILKQDVSNLRRELSFTASFTPVEIANFCEAFPAIPDEIVVIQGSVDLAIIRPDGIWIVDFKTDHIGLEELATRTKEHAPQLRLYAAALEKIYSRRVTRATLYFLRLGRKVEVTSPALLSSSPS